MFSETRAVNIAYEHTSRTKAFLMDAKITGCSKEQIEYFPLSHLDARWDLEGDFAFVLDEASYTSFALTIYTILEDLESCEVVSTSRVRF